MPQTLNDPSGPGFIVHHAIDAAGFAFRKTALRPWLRLPSHAHRRATLLVVVGGTYHETVEGRPQSYPALTVIAKPPGQEHSNDQRGQSATCVEIEVSDRRLDGLERHGRLFQRRTVVRGGAVGAVALRAAHELTIPDAFTALALEGLALEMIAAAGRPEPRLSRQSRQWLDQVRQLLDAATAPPALSTIAETVGLHPVYLARAFRKEFGCAPSEYVMRRRIERAQALLAGSTQSVARVAFGLGFCDQSHFSKSFRRQVGVSPAEFRRRQGSGKRPAH